MNGGYFVGISAGVAPLAAVAPVGFDINAILLAIGAAGGGAAAWKVVTIIVDKLVPSRSDKRSEVEVSMNALAKTIEILSAEKVADAGTIARANARITELTADGSRDYELLRALRETVTDLEAAIARKDSHIATLSARLAEYGMLVSFDRDGHMRITPKTGPIPLVASA